ncbi:FAD binding domain-containing protein [Gigaspora rosea]|uniref:FAD binding domain-containing protein n=1 Tax=Gigaspora rosea TaxID=44941 RepID=A0A397UJV2_9GLOM|nr:FAD binding domain-containing protein [Gigaspora rosea]
MNANVYLRPRSDRHFFSLIIKIINRVKPELRNSEIRFVDRNSFFGGNTMKATSGINGALTKTQIALGVRDLAHPDLIKVLTGYSASVPDRSRIIKKARVTKLIKEGDAVIGVEYVKNGQTCKEYGPVILATGGYAADFTEDPLLKKYRPDIYNLPTTNGEHSTGDGHKMVIVIGVKATHMEKVQVHLTPKEPDAKIKFLAAEALRGVGGLLLNGHHNYVTGEIWKTKVPHFKHYVGRGLMRNFLVKLAKEIGISASQLKATFDDYNDIASNKKKDPFGKKFFHNVPITINDQFHVALMSPVLYYTMIGRILSFGMCSNGRVAGDSASRCIFQNLSSATANRHLVQIARQLAPYQTTVSVDLTNQKDDPGGKKNPF